MFTKETLKNGSQSSHKDGNQSVDREERKRFSMAEEKCRGNSVLANCDTRLSTRQGSHEGDPSKVLFKANRPEPGDRRF